MQEPMNESMDGATATGRLDYAGRVAIVTGGARGMGAAYARLLADRGATVVVNDLGVNVRGTERDDAGAAESMAAELRALGARASADTTDVSDAAGMSALVAGTIARYGRVDILINNAGSARLAPFLDTTSAEFGRQLEVHLGGAYNLTRAAWPQLVAQGYGRVVLVSSSALFGMAGNLLYATAKAGLIGLVRSLAQVEPELDITVNGVLPRANTRMTAPDLSTDASRQVVLPPESVAAVVGYLVHESCRCSGELFGAGGGKIDRLALGVTRGVAFPELTPEDVAASIAAAGAADGVWYPADCLDHADSLWAGRPAP